MQGGSENGQTLAKAEGWAVELGSSLVCSQDWAESSTQAVIQNEALLQGLRLTPLQPQVSVGLTCATVLVELGIYSYPLGLVFHLTTHFFIGILNPALTRKLWNSLSCLPCHHPMKDLCSAMHICICYLNLPNLDDPSEMSLSWERIESVR